MPGGGSSDQIGSRHRSFARIETDGQALGAETLIEIDGGCRSCMRKHRESHCMSGRFVSASSWALTRILDGDADAPIKGEGEGRLAGGKM